MNMFFIVIYFIVIYFYNLFCLLRLSPNHDVIIIRADNPKGLILL